jgi:RES domain-containing protein
VPTLYRIVHKQYQDDPFSGKGGLYNKSRWASRGQLVSYAADHLATATLETLTGLQRADLMAEMVYARAEIDAEHTSTLPEEDLPDGWDRLPATNATRDVGDAWLETENSVVLRVPSVVLPHTYNYVVNAAHPDRPALRVAEVAPLLLDNRVLARIGAGDT